MKKFLKKLHFWLSVPAGAIIFIMCLTGSILVFQQPVLEWLNPQIYYVKKTTEETLPLDKLFNKAESQLPDSVYLLSVTVPAQSNRNYTFGINGQRHASVNVDPYTGLVSNQLERGRAFFGTVLRLHRWLLFPVKRGEFSLGKFFTGLSTLLFFFILVSGIVIWIPQTAKLLKQRLSVKTEKGIYRFWYDTHLAGGIYAAVLLITFCLTGLTWSFDWYRKGFYKVFGVETTQSSRPGNSKSRQNPIRNNGNTVDYAIWDKVLQELKQQVPDYKKITIEAGRASVFPNKQTGIADFYTFDETSGKITGVQYYSDTATRASKLRMWIYKIHVGKWGGTVSQILTFLAALIGASLPVTGFYMYFKKLVLKRNKNKNITHT